jgi:hypothetical protein
LQLGPKEKGERPTEVERKKGGVGGFWFQTFFMILKTTQHQTTTMQDNYYAQTLCDSKTI